MPDVTTACPDDATLRSYLRGEVSNEQLDTLAEHFRDCSGCLTRMSDLERAESRPINSPAVEDADPELEKAVQRLLDPKREKDSSLLVAPPPTPGDRIGQYRLLEQIGEGGMGTTFKAVHIKLDRTVALKILRPALLHDRSAVARFNREMRAIGRLQHPNIVLALDAGEVGGFLYLAMELVPGETLSQRVRRQGALPVEQACRVGLAAARALEHAHAAGLVHRDIKPSNLMLTPDGSVKLLDMGLVRLVAHEPSTTSSPEEVEPSRISDVAGAIGTSDYMSPEQWRCSAKLDGRADQYGLGCTLFYLLVGKPPFTGENSRTPYDKMQLHLNEPPPKIRKLRPEVPALLEGVIDRLLAKKPANRFDNITEVAKHLETVIEGVATDEAPAAKPQYRRRPRWMLPVLAAAVVLLGVMIGVVAFMKLSSNTSNPSVASQPVAAEPPPNQGRIPMTAEEAVKLQQVWAEYAHRPIMERHTVGMDFVLVPAGILPVGPQTFVSLPTAYQMSRTEVTVAQFRQFVTESNYKTTAELRGGGHLPPPDLKPGGTRPRIATAKWDNPGYDGQNDDHPVVQITWDDAVAFCEWLTKQDGLTYRLPTEWEWGWACRAGVQGPWPVADEKELPDYAWYRKNCELQPRAVGGRHPNRWGFHDILGNVHEWVANTKTTLPAGTIVSPPGDTDGNMRYIWGGGFETVSPHAGYWERFNHNYPYVKIGFRVLRELPKAP